MIGVTFEGIEKRFAHEGGTRTILQHLNLEVAPGEVIALVGRSGCGKTTLLNLAAGLTRADEGRLTFSAPPRVGYVFQDARLLPWLTLEGNLTLVQPNVTAARVSHELARVGLAGRQRDYPSQLSLGMAQRAAVARALIIEPNLLLLDEPFGALDELTANELRAELLRLLQQTRATTLLVTHNPIEAVMLADRIVIIAGRPARERHVIDVNAQLDRSRPFDDPRVWALSRKVIDLLGHEAA
ncbi:ABC transporter ATP-binding protein [Deinococcus yavapaiensis]|uniref:NitT/TauT family transport system ATP-binding protein/sulfonate transport system ATP-binding protein n=1 Tax=Deinococcus yavapaiensis KR-236 TaxID=694435 RepID=A0A318S588_9DEIO|nr:ATP-binding cassette domain-containing protein [Deinococcus yavapaiensis]PYE53274.1 NitT/TauT family transport system ATP-binding protein/sulfonate transport system ATP-binding protein [Deinococcus yavapaiensis KR-236]